MDQKLQLTIKQARQKGISEQDIANFANPYIQQQRARRVRDLQEKQKKQSPSKIQGRGGFLSSIISEGSALGGAAAGGAAGSAFGPLGTLGGAIIGGAAAGFGGRLAENKVRDDRGPFEKESLKQAAQEGAISGIAVGPIKAVKAGSGAIKGARTGVGAKQGAEEAITKPGFMSRMTGGRGANMRQGLQDRAATNLLQLTPAQNKRLLDSGVDPTKLAQVANRYGADAETIIGRTGSKGPLQDTIRSLEAGIKRESDIAGRNVRIPGDELITALKDQRKTIAKELGGGTRAKAMDKIIADAQLKYANGVTVKQARDILREANQKFGASVLDDSKGAIASAAQKLEGNVMRQALKDRFPTIAKALDDEAELIQLREILKGTRAKNITGGFKTGGLDVTRPGTFLDPLLNSKAASKRLLGKETVEGATPKVIPGPVGFASRILAAKSLTPSAPAEEQQPPEITEADQAIADSFGLQLPDMPGLDAEARAALQEDQSPFSEASIQQAILEDLQTTGGENTAMLMKLYETFGKPSAATTKPQSAESAKVSGIVGSGLQSLDRLESIIASGGVPKGTTVPGRGLLGGAGQAVLGTAEYDAAADNIADAMVRLRTGAAATKEELALYRRLLPQAFDSPEVQAQKMQQVRDYFADISGRTGGAGNDTQALLGL